MPTKFPVMMRGYDIRQVDEIVAMTDAALSTTDKLEWAAIARLRESHFQLKFRGYSRLQVDNYIEHRILELSLLNQA